MRSLVFSYLLIAAIAGSDAVEGSTEATVRRVASLEAFESAAFSWNARASLPIQVRASHDGVEWTTWQTLRTDDDMTDVEAGRSFSGIVHFGEAMRFVEILAEADVKATFFPLPPRRSRQIAATYPFGTSEVVSRTEWGCPDGQGARWTPSYTSVTHAIVHHTAGSNNVSDWAAEVLNIWRFHTIDRGWGDIGYNFLIDPNGVVYEGRAGGDGALGAHFSCRNTNTVGIALLGTFTTTPPTTNALASLKAVLRELTARFGLDPTAVTLHTPSGLTMSPISSHRDGNASPLTCTRTECPGDALYALLPAIRAELSGRVPPRRRSVVARP